MKWHLRVLICLAVLCLVLTGAPAPCSAEGTASGFYVTAHSNLYQDAFPVHLYEKDGALFIDAVTLAGISGYEQVDEKSFSLGGRIVSPSRSVRIGGKTCFPMEQTLDRFCVRYWAKDGELYFMSGRDALRPLFEADVASLRFRPLLDPDNDMNTLGVALAYAKDILMTWNFKGVMERYRTAMYKLVQEDMDETTFSTLQKKWEDGINKPISTTFSFLESFMDEEEISAFYAESDLMEIKSYMDGVKLEEKVLGMSLSAYLRRLEEIGLYFNTNVYALRAMEYAAEAEPVNSSDKDIIKAAKEITRSAAMKTDGWDARLLGQLAREHVTALLYSTGANLLKEMMLGKKSLAPKVLKSVLDRIPAIRFMSSLEEAYVFAEIQQFFESEMISAEVYGSWVKFKYMAIMYYRCFYASCDALRDADMKDAVPDWENQIREFKEKAQAQIAALASVPDSALEPYQFCGVPVDPSELQRCEGPEPDYGLLAPFRDEEDGENVPDAVLRGAKEAWETACSHYGRVPLAEYGGEIYLDEGDGAALPLMCRAGGEYFVVVLLQRGETLAQMVFRIDGNGSFRQVYYDVTLTLGERQALYLYEQSGSALISMADLDGDMAAFAAAAPQTVEKRLFQGDETAESIADVGSVSWEAIRTLYGDPEWTVRVDANYGLFHLQFQDPQRIRSLFGVTVP